MSYEALSAVTDIISLDTLMILHNAYIQSGNDAFLNDILPYSSIRTPNKLVDFNIVCYTCGNKMNENVGLAFLLMKQDFDLLY